MAGENPQIDLKPIEKSLSELDKKLSEMTRISKAFEQDMIQKSNEASHKQIGQVGAVIFGTVVLGLFSLAQDDGSVKQAIEGMNEALSTFAGTVAPIFAAVINMLTGVINAFNSLPEPAKLVILVGAMIAAALMAILPVIANVTIALTTMTAATSGLVASALPIIAIVAGIILVIAALVAGLIYAYTHFEGFRNLVNSVWASIQAGLAAVWAVVQTALVAIADFFIAQWQRVVSWWNTMLPTFMTIWNAIWAFLQPIIQVIVTFVQAAFENMKTIFIAAWEIIKAVIITVWEIIKAVISTAISIITNVISAFAYLLTGQWGKAWQSVLNILKSIGAMIASVVGSLINGILSILSSLLGMVGGLFRNAWNSAWQITGQLLGGLADLIWGKISGIGDRIRNFCSEAASWGANLITQFISGIRSKIQGVINAVNDVIGPVKDFLGFSSPTKKGPGSQSHKWAPNFMEMFTAGIRMGIPALKSVASQSVSQLAVLGQSQGVGGPALVGAADSAPGIHIAQMNVRNDQDIRLISQELWRLHQRQARSLGGRV